MAFLETFSAVFGATLLGQISIWFVQRYITTHFTKLAEKIEKPIRRRLKKAVKKKDYSKSVIFRKRNKQNGRSIIRH